jgi:hypothetical protein
MASYTSFQSGNWSLPSTWVESNIPGDGDTVTIGSHTITVNTNTTIGTSPNDITTKVINLTSASSILKVASNVTLVIKGNRGAVNGSKFQQEAGSIVTFDASASGGTPTYTDINVGFTQYVFNGLSGNPTILQAVSGRVCGVNANWSLFTATYSVFRRVSGLNITSISGNVTITDCTFDTCGRLGLTSNTVTASCSLLRNTFISGTHASNDVLVGYSTTATSGTREFGLNVLNKGITYISKSFNIHDNYFGGNWESTSSSSFTIMRNNFFKMDGTVNGGGGTILASSADNNYFYMINEVGNPHFVALYAELANQELSNCIFEYDGPDAIDTGDCVFPYSSGGNIAIVRNNIVLPSSRTGNPYTSGTLATIFNTDNDRICQFIHNTVFARSSANQTAALNFSEATNGHAGEISVFKSNLIWSDLPNTALIATRIQGTVNGVLAASGVDYNCLFNGMSGDNGRGYNDRANNLDLWTGGIATINSAANSNVDNHQLTVNPMFLDSTRNLAKWCLVNSYGSQNSIDGLSAIKNDVTRISDLINYVQEGFAPQNPLLKGVGHDGLDIGAVDVLLSNLDIVVLLPSLYLGIRRAIVFSGGSRYQVLDISNNPLDYNVQIRANGDENNYRSSF